MAILPKLRYIAVAGVFVFSVFFLIQPAVAQTGWDSYQKGLKLQEEGNVQDALAEFQRAIDSEPDNAFFQNAMGLAKIDAANYDGALANLSRAVSIDPNLPEAYSGLGVCYNAMGEYDKSIDSFKKALELTPEDNPDTAVIYNNIGQNYYLMKNYDEAIGALTQALQKNENLLTGYINFGNVYTELGDFEKAVTYHEKAVELAPDYALPRNNLAFAYYKLGEYDKSLEQMQKVVETDPTNEQFKRNLAFLKSEKEKKENQTYAQGPLKGLPKEVTLKPRSGSAPAPQVTSKRPVEKAPEEKSVSKVEEKTVVAQKPVAPKKVVQRTPSPERKQAPVAKPEAAPQKPVVVADRRESAPAANVGYERRQRESTMPEKEAAQIRKVKELSQSRLERATDFYRAAKYNLSNGDVEHAEKDINKAMELYPDNLDYKVVGGLIEEQKGYLHRAANIFNAVLKEDPNHSVALNSLGHVHHTLGRVDIARGEYEKAFQADMTNGCAAGNIGSLSALEGDCKTAKEMLTKAAERNCLKAAVLNNISVCYFEEGDIYNAQQLTYRALELEPENKKVVSNFSYLMQKSETKYDPIKVPKDIVFDSYDKLPEYSTEVPLSSLTPVDTINFYDVFRNNYHKKTVVVIPFQNPKGTEKWDPRPGDLLTRRLANSLRETGYFKVVVPNMGDFNGMSFQEKTSDETITEIVDEYAADIVYAGRLERNRLVDTVKKKYKGLRKTDYVAGEYPIETLIMLADRREPLYDDMLIGEAGIDGAKTYLLSYREVKEVKESAFRDYCDSVTNIIMDHFHLIEYPVLGDVVKYIKTEPRRSAMYVR
ncbi:MAG TPA: tetratricopeptide repeat protein [bacterium]|nr:tetratricopeptide repeat protein [bacterium]